MNTVRSTWIGWGTLSIAGAGAYYFAKKSIDAEKKEKFEAQQRRRQLAASLETQAMHSSQSRTKKTDRKATADIGSAGIPDTMPAIDAESKTRKRSKYEPTEAYKTKKGDRFS